MKYRITFDYTSPQGEFEYAGDFKREYEIVERRSLDLVYDYAEQSLVARGWVQRATCFEGKDGRKAFIHVDVLEAMNA